MQIKEIIKLTKQEYEEVQIQSIFPNWAKDLSAVHTINFTGKLSIIDAVIRRRK